MLLKIVAEFPNQTLNRSIPLPSRVIYIPRLARNAMMMANVVAECKDQFIPRPSQQALPLSLTIIWPNASKMVRRFWGGCAVRASDTPVPLATSSIGRSSSDSDNP